MIDDIKKSFNSILYERTTSPFYGTLILSWLIWNWRIIYLTFFISEGKIEENKIDFIITNFSDIHHLITYPLISTTLLILIFPFVSNGAYWLSLRFNKWKKDQKNIIDMKQLLTVEQSIELREQIANQEDRFEKLLENKNSEIKQLNLIIENYKSRKAEPIIENKNNSEIWKDELKKLVEKLKSNTNLLNEYESVLHYIQGGFVITGRDSISSKTISLMESFDIIKSQGDGVYQITDKGKLLQREMID